MHFDFTGLMSNHLLILWMNRAGIILSFASFWFAAPDLFGAERLNQWKKSLESRIHDLPRRFVNFIVRLIFAVIATYAATYFGLFLQWVRNHYCPIPGWLETFLTDVLLLAVIVALLLLFGPILAPLREWLEKRAAVPFLSHLANDAGMRGTLLKIAALLFVLGTILQFVATFERTP